MEGFSLVKEIELFGLAVIRLQELAKVKRVVGKKWILF
jgi:hypothetical protein